eukprot:3385929-Rhodomonas_salina.2
MLFSDRHTPSGTPALNFDSVPGNSYERSRREAESVFSKLPVAPTGFHKLQLRIVCPGTNKTSSIRWYNKYLYTASTVAFFQRGACALAVPRVPGYP